MARSGIQLTDEALQVMENVKSKTYSGAVFDIAKKGKHEEVIVSKVWKKDKPKMIKRVLRETKKNSACYIAWHSVLKLTGGNTNYDQMFMMNWVDEARAPVMKKMLMASTAKGMQDAIGSGAQYLEVQDPTDFDVNAIMEKILFKTKSKAMMEQASELDGCSLVPLGGKGSKGKFRLDEPDDDDSSDEDHQ